MLIRFCGGNVLLLLLGLWNHNIVEAFDMEGIRRTAIVPPADNTRRNSLERISFITLVGISSILSPTTPSYASESENSVRNDGDLNLAQPMGPSAKSRPAAPIEYLLPAARVGIYIYQLLSITEELTKLQQTSSSSNADARNNNNEQKIAVDRSDIITKLDALLLSPPPFIKNNDPTVSRGDQYGKYSLPIIGEIGVAAQKQKQRKDRFIEVGFLPQFFEVGELVGERRQWNLLQSAERKREGASEIRRAFNIYTTNLNFNPNKYQWVGSTQEKSRLIRDDKLPTATDVIRSDLDARDLYRNQVQTYIDDARAEFEYQKKNSSGDVQKFDPAELLDILRQARASLDKWFGFVPGGDVKSALEIVQREQA